MKKSKAIRLLENQIDKIEDKNIQRDEWLSSTASVLLRVFPVSSQIKIEQLSNIEKSPQYFEDISAEERIALRKSKARRYLLNYIEEIDLLGVESSGNKLEIFFGSLRFWILLVALCGLSFLVGNTTPAKVIKQSHIQDYQEMEQQIIHQKKKIDSLTRELQNKEL